MENAIQPFRLSSESDEYSPYPFVKNDKGYKPEDKAGGTDDFCSRRNGQASIHGSFAVARKTDRGWTDRYSAAMGTLADIDVKTLNATHAFMEAVADRYDVAGAILFGSRARKSHRPDSDADVAVLLHGHPGKFVATKLAMADLAYDVLLDTGIRIQPLPVWEDEWNHPETYSNPLSSTTSNAKASGYERP